MLINRTDNPAICVGKSQCEINFIFKESSLFGEHLHDLIMGALFQLFLKAGEPENDAAHAEMVPFHH